MLRHRIAGENTQSILWRLHRGAVDGISPKVVVLMVGINNLSASDPAIDTVHGIKTILTTLRNKLPQSKVLLLAVWPGEVKLTAPALQQKIVEANKSLGELQDNKVYFLDLGKIALERHSSDFFIDGLHPSRSGYERLGPPLARAIEKLKAPNVVISRRMQLEL